MGHAYPLIDVAAPEGAELLDRLHTERSMVMLLGSAISSWEPGGLPTGSTITNAIAEKLGSGTVAKAEVVREMIAHTAFEHVMECSPDEERVRGLFAAAFHPVQPNEVHRAIVRLMRDGIVADAVTTNYDTGLEAAAGFSGVPFPIIDPEDVQRAPAGVPRLFKIHGCASRKDSLAFALHHERLMEPWKRDELFSLVRGRVLLVMGYSGMDFEICPELVNAGAARVFWLHFDPGRQASDPDALEEMTANARRVLDETGGTVLWGNLVHVLEALTEASVNARWSDAPATFVDTLFSAFSPGELDAWRMRLYNGIGCARDARAVAERALATTADGPTRRQAALEAARSLFHLGRYRDAVREYESVVSEAEQAGDRALLRGALHGLAESNRVGGWYWNAHATLGKFGGLIRSASSPAERESLQAEAAFLNMLLLSNYVLVAAKTRARPLERRLRKRAHELLKIAVPYAIEHGDWPALQQGVLWAKRLGIPFEEIYPGPMFPLPAEEGYRQLGYRLAAMMALRDHLKRGEIGPDDVRDPEGLLSTAWEIGNYPEMWKFAAAYTRAGGSISPEWRRLAREARAKCDEGLLRRIGTRLGMG